MLLLRRGCRTALLNEVPVRPVFLSCRADECSCECSQRGSFATAGAEALLPAHKLKVKPLISEAWCTEALLRLQGNTSIVNLTDLSTTAVSVGLGARTICSAAMQQTLHVSRTGGDETSQPRLFEKEVLYRGRWMVPFRVLVRLKIFQLAGVASLAIPLNSFLLEGAVSGTSIAIASALLVGCGVVSTTLWYYSRRYVGELSLVRQPSSPTVAVCFSVLDFWGRREDNVVQLEDIIPPLRDLSTAALYELALQPLIPVEVLGDRQYYISLRHGILTDKTRLIHLLEGKTTELTAL